MRNQCFITAVVVFLNVTTSAQFTRAYRPPTPRRVPRYLRRLSPQCALLTPDREALRRATDSSGINWARCPPEAQDLGTMCGTLPVPLDSTSP